MMNTEEQKWCYCWPPHPVTEVPMTLYTSPKTPLMAILIGEPDDNCPICQQIKAGKDPVAATFEAADKGQEVGVLLTTHIPKPEESCP